MIGLLIISLIACLVVGCAGWWGYEAGKKKGIDEGYDAGFSNGYRKALSVHGLIQPWGKSDLEEMMMMQQPPDDAAGSEQ